MASRSRWRLPEISEPDVTKLAARCGLQMPAARVLWARGLREPSCVDHFLRPRLSDLEDPFQLLGMEPAVERIQRALRDGEKILIYGDYDVDGTSSVVILKKMLELLGHQARYHVPDRLKDGYGIQTHVLDQARADGVSLVISVDTGIRAVDALKHAQALGLDVIVTDHHLPEAELPPAYAVLNPNRSDCPYPNKNLCGAGVTFKLIQALMERSGWAPDRIVRFSDSFLILVAVATIADMVPLLGENRIMVKRGLEGLKKTRNPGLRALMMTAGVDAGEALTTQDIAFRLAPRINAAGRMEHAKEVVELFLTSDEVRAHQIATRLELLNTDRQRACETMIESIIEMFGPAGPSDTEAGFVFYDPSWHRGVVGIVAQRLVELFNRPTLVLGLDEATGLAQGSGRSVASFHLLQALESMPELFHRFGGHRQAVGLALDPANLELLRERFNQAVITQMGEDVLVPERDLDAELTLEELNDSVAEEILHLAPFGLGNKPPEFLVRNVTLSAAPEPFGRDGKHLRLKVSNRDRRQFMMKAWRFAERCGELSPGRCVDLALSIENDSYSLKRGYAGWSIVLRDVRPAVS